MCERVCMTVLQSCVDCGVRFDKFDCGCDSDMGEGVREMCEG